MSNILICTPYIRRADGTIDYASNHGLKAFCFEVTEEENEAYWKKRGKPIKPPEVEGTQTH